MSWFVRLKWYILPLRYIWKFSEPMHWNIWTWYWISMIRGLAWQACLKNTEIELELLTDIDMLLTVEKRIGGVICHTIHKYATANNKYMKNYGKDRIILFYVFGCKQSIWIFNVSNITCKWIWMEKNMSKFNGKTMIKTVI